MKSLHLNIGYQFAHPYESPYARLRRLMVVNPGLSRDRLRQTLKALMPDQDPFTTGLEALQREPTALNLFGYGSGIKSYQRQCPQCARLLFHCDVQYLPWLARCPIHHSAFTDTCPVCHEPWPSVEAMAQRDCPGCGRGLLKDLGAYLGPLDTHPIEQILAFIGLDEDWVKLEPGYPYRADVFRELWCKEITLLSPKFASCQVDRKRTWPSALLDSLEILRYPMRHKTTRVQLLSRPKRPIVDFYRRPPNYINLKDAAQTRLKGDFAVMKRIVRWIHRQVPAHRIHLLSYRDLTVRFFQHAPPVCPYCLALSLWFFLTAKKRYVRYYPKDDRYYPFMVNFIFEGMIDIWQPYVSIGQNYFQMSPAFSDWFYRRGLEISYTALLRSSFAWIRWLAGDLNEQARKRALQHLSDTDVHPDMTYQLQLSGQRVRFYYEMEHPLEGFDPPPLEKVDQRCVEYAHHHLNSRDVIERYVKEFEADQFNEQVFLDAHCAYRELLANSIYDYQCPYINHLPKVVMVDEKPDAEHEALRRMIEGLLRSACD